MPISGIFGYRILPSGKIRARKAQSKKSLLDFFDKLNARRGIAAGVMCCQISSSSRRTSFMQSFTSRPRKAVASAAVTA